MPPAACRRPRAQRIEIARAAPTCRPAPAARTRRARSARRAAPDWARRTPGPRRGPRRAAGRRRLASIAASSSRQVFGSGAVTQIGTFSSRSTLAGFGPRTATLIRDRAWRTLSPGCAARARRRAPHANSGEEDGDVDVAEQQLRGEVDRRAVRLERQLAQRRCHDRTAAGLRNQRRDSFARRLSSASTSTRSRSWLSASAPRQPGAFGAVRVVCRRPAAAPSRRAFDARGERAYARRRRRADPRGRCRAAPSRRAAGRPPRSR